MVGGEQLPAANRRRPGYWLSSLPIPTGHLLRNSSNCLLLSSPSPLISVWVDLKSTKLQHGLSISHFHYIPLAKAEQLQLKHQHLSDWDIHLPLHLSFVLVHFFKPPLHHDHVATGLCARDFSRTLEWVSLCYSAYPQGIDENDSVFIGYAESKPAPYYSVTLKHCGATTSNSSIAEHVSGRYTIFKESVYSCDFSCIVCICVYIGHVGTKRESPAF